MVTIRLRRNGPYVIEGDDVRVVDWDGQEYQVERRPIALCRCGASSTKPFCDGTHKSLAGLTDEGPCERAQAVDGQAGGPAEGGASKRGD